MCGGVLLQQFELEVEQSPFVNNSTKQSVSVENCESLYIPVLIVFKPNNHHCCTFWGQVCVTVWSCSAVYLVQDDGK